jgi:hypothetical protein
MMSGAHLLAKAYQQGFEDGMSFIESPSGGGASEQL